MKYGKVSISAFGAALLPACTTMSHGDMSTGVPPLIDIGASSADFDAPGAPSGSATPGQLSFELEARPARVELADGRFVDLWTYNGSMPGPTLEAHVGDLIRVHLKNSLPVETTIHWHGVRVPADMDGIPGPATTIAPGGELTYEFTATDPGTFWYHPHVSSAEQVERGLYGALVIRDDAEPAVTSEHIAVLDDILLANDGELAAFSSMQGMLGRQGNVLLVNGHAQPTLTVSPRGLHRFRFVDAASARYFRLSLGGRAFHVIGFDNGKLEAPRSVTELLLVPGSRADVLVDTPDDGKLNWQTLSYERGHGTGEQATGSLSSAEVSGEPADALPLPSSFPSIVSLPRPSVARSLLLGESTTMMQGASSMGATFSINGKVYPNGEEFNATLGRVEEWQIKNDTAMDHPFHLHGFRFQVVSENGAPPAFASYFDTINVPARQTTTIRIPLEANPGKWMFHCHVLEHAELGMMGELNVTANE